jgi:hypothetical protein
VTGWTPWWSVLRQKASDGGRQGGAGLPPPARRRLAATLLKLKRATCPFVNLPNSRHGRWGEVITAENMATIIWVKPSTVAQVAFTEWTEGGSLRHARSSPCAATSARTTSCANGEGGRQSIVPVTQLLLQTIHGIFEVGQLHDEVVLHGQ